MWLAVRSDPAAVPCTLSVPLRTSRGGRRDERATGDGPEWSEAGAPKRSAWGPELGSGPANCEVLVLSRCVRACVCTAAVRFDCRGVAEGEAPAGWRRPWLAGSARSGARARRHDLCPAMARDLRNSNSCLLVFLLPRFPIQRPYIDPRTLRRSSSSLPWLLSPSQHAWRRPASTGVFVYHTTSSFGHPPAMPTRADFFAAPRK